MKRNIERDCIDDEGHKVINYHHWKKCEKCGMTWFYTKNNNPTKVDDEKPVQPSHPTPHQKYQD